jgi:drug/metabolite transporter (DMT)-like permease
MAIGLISIISPITAAGAIVPVAVGLARGEAITAIQAAGIAFAILGVALVSRPTEPSAGGRLAAGVGLALISALTLGIFLTALGIASETDPVWSTFVQRCTTSALLAAAVIFSRPALALARTDIGVLATIGLLDAGATLLFASAAALGSLATTAVLASLYPVFPLLLAQTFLQERISGLHWLGIVVVITGACMITAFG